jgi:lipoprotein NlpD
VKRAAACCAAAAVLMLAGCSSRPVQAPVIERAPPTQARAAAPPVADTRPETYTVKRGDTLFSIALDQGHDYKELAAWNNLDNPNRIRPGQQLRLKPPPGVQEAPVTVSPVTSSERVETHPLAAQVPMRAEPAVRPPGTQEAVKSEPQARKLPYSPENVALLERGETRLGAGPVPAPPPAAAAVPPPAPATAPGAKSDADVDDEDKVEWGWPVRGKILSGFSEASNKGLDIAGKLGDPVIASAPGRVVYSGSGLRGYGKLVIIKHNKTYLSAYAHNKDVLVKEGQSVVKGQKIAEIGNTDTDAPKLHFEIRKLGKPVDPARFLPPT